MTQQQTKRLAQLGVCVSTPLGELGVFGASKPHLTRLPQRPKKTTRPLRFDSLDQIFKSFEIADGQTLSFHHHYRNGDRVMNAVLLHAHKRGLRNLTIAPSSIFQCHDVLAPLIKAGTITNVVTNYMRGQFADEITAGLLSGQAILQSHGGRARAIASGQLKIDIAFIGAPLANEQGDLTGRTQTDGCGPLGYPAVDAFFARRSVGLIGRFGFIPEHLVDISGAYIDGVLPFDEPGSTKGIKSGATVPSQSKATQKVCAHVVDCMQAAGFIRNGVSIQSGAGGHSLAAIEHIADQMRSAGVKGSFISGGITQSHVAMLEQSLFEQIKDVQCFDLEAVISSTCNSAHTMMTAEEYASPLLPNAVAHSLSVMLLGAVEIDQHFNVNVVCGGHGKILGGPGGHPDTAEGAELVIVTSELTAGGFPKLVSDVQCVSTLGQYIDLLVTEEGVVVHPERTALKSRLQMAGVHVREFEELQRLSEARASKLPMVSRETPNVLIESRDGLVLDWL